MRLDPALDAVYILGALWGGFPGAQVCPSSPGTLTQPVINTVKGSISVIAFIDVNVVPMDTERVLTNQTVLVEGSRITALGSSGQIQVPASAVRIDGRGKYLMPGLGHSHDHETWGDFKGLVVQRDTVVASPEPLHALARNLTEGVTAVAVPGGFEQLSAVRRFLTTVPSPHFYFATGISHRIRQQGIDSVAAYITARKAAGYTHITGSGDDSFLVAAARRGGLPVTWHGHWESFAAVLALGAAGGNSDHLQFYKDSINLDGDAWQRMSLDELRPKMQVLATAIQRAGVWMTPTLRCQVGPVGYWPASHPRVSSPRNVFDAKFNLQFTKILHEAGVPLLLSADDNWSPHDELTAFVQAGLTPYQALVAGTRNLAQYFGRLDSVGTVTVGKRADLVLLYDNPLKDIRHAREPAGVMADGRWLDRAALDELLLASPKLWLSWVLRSRGDPSSFHTQNREEKKLGSELGQRHRAELLALMDSLVLATPKTPEYRRQAQQFAAELGVLRTLLPPEQQRAWLDPWARVWLRMQARQGYPITIPGVMPTP